MREKLKIGDRVNMLEVVAFAGRDKHYNVMYTCRCDCGNLKDIRQSSLLSGKYYSCGCYVKGNNRKLNTKHGMYYHPLYKIWNGIRNRCRNKRSSSYKNYGGRGIDMCDEWYNDINTFISDMGDRPHGMSIERIDNNGNYCQENCVWANSETQANNKRNAVRIIYKGESKTIKEWSAITGIKQSTLRARLLRGWSDEDIIGKEVR